ncbi:protein-tyrosine phosphatase [Comamonas sp. BIGb0124]|uniref:low molecular weight protein-tyrosine-phosphatase n=1 Tax=Comamonas sp. BIGb0124 TaxID=2485130 RepID=UPI000F4A911C|nr:low molecular weight protein-tyrosine-phosphatase [Comamonas sp. BIGb0124]ROR18598.1 protein-tyrosine phosphatase [Comamonas sp. BIGb0124]
MIGKVLIVCVGNICRSPMAEALLRNKLNNIQVGSAGLGALVGYPADPHAVELMTDAGLDIRPHRARQLTLAMCKEHDMILVMENEHRDAIEKMYPFTKGKVFRIGHNQNVDIPDPYRLDKSAFEYALRLIEAGIDDWSQRIRKL